MIEVVSISFFRRLIDQLHHCSNVVAFVPRGVPQLPTFADPAGGPRCSAVGFDDALKTHSVHWVLPKKSHSFDAAAACWRGGGGPPLSDLLKPVTLQFPSFTPRLLPPDLLADEYV